MGEAAIDGDNGLILMRDVIFISLENWDGIWRRNQFLCAEWLRRFPGMRMLFVGRSRDVSHAVRTGEWSGLRGGGLRRSEEFDGLTLLNPWKLFPNSVSPGRKLNIRWLGAQIRSAASHAGLRAPLLWINDHCAEPLAGHLNERAVVYDITDDWTLMPSLGDSERSRVRSFDARLCGRADLVVVCSDALERSRKNKCRRIVKVPNGVDAAHYRTCREGFPVRDNRSPVFGYVGTLHGDRLDFELVEALARAYPEGRVVLCGPDLLTPVEKQRLEKHPNIQRLDAVDYKNVPGVIAGFDVCILPHLRTPFTESLNPIKLWEYLASSKPVAATPVAGFREMAHLCHLGVGASGFVAACGKALTEDPSRAASRVAEAEANSWRARSEQLLEVFRQQGWLGRPMPKPRRATRQGHKTTNEAKWTDCLAKSQGGSAAWSVQTQFYKTT